MAQLNDLHIKRSKLRVILLANTEIPKHRIEHILDPNIACDPPNGLRCIPQLLCGENNLFRRY